MKKWTYFFSKNFTEGNKNMENLLGNKGANLAEIAQLGLSVPPGFTIISEACQQFLSKNSKSLDEIKIQILSNIKILNKDLNKEFGNPLNPLLVSVRSGSKVSMPGMMDSILNIGLNDDCIMGLSKFANDERFAHDCYLRLLEMFGQTVYKIPKSEFNTIKSHYINKFNFNSNTELALKYVKMMVHDFKKVYQNFDFIFPQDPIDQLFKAITCVFKSWFNKRAVKYRQIHNMPEDLGTAVNVQSMVFGNSGNSSATGVCFTRDPSTGNNQFYGEFLINAQGEDIVNGSRTPLQISKKYSISLDCKDISLDELMPEVYEELVIAGKKLEIHFKDMQDIEFTIQDKKLWLLQTRSGKRSTIAALKIAVAQAQEGIITKQEAIMRIKPQDIENLLHPSIDLTNNSYEVIARGLPASPGAASGLICFNSKDAEILGLNRKIILLRTETSPEDISGLNLAQGIVTLRGGMTSHAAVVARGMGKPCVIASGNITIDETKKLLYINDLILSENDIISINGTTGDIILGEIETLKAPELPSEFYQMLKWCDKIKKLGVRVNADNKDDCIIAKNFGAEGVGLCRTEHMFFNTDRILKVRQMILSNSKDEKNRILNDLFEYQKSDFKSIFKSMSKLPVTIRLLDPPLHEFLPNHNTDLQELSNQMSLNLNDLRLRINSLKEVNPMLGHRGCRLAITNPEIYEMQVRAIFEAAIEENFDNLEIMIPLVQNVAELEYCKKLIKKVFNEKITELKQKKLNYKIGIMIELPKSAIIADTLAKSSNFFSFGTNDLTQTTLGLSRDDSTEMIKDYINKGIIMHDPFQIIDTEGVGELVKMALNKGSKANKDIKFGICGEHGGDPDSINFFHKIGINYVSCSVVRISVAKLAAAQAQIKFG